MANQRMMSWPQGALGSAWKSPIGLIAMMMRPDIEGPQEGLTAGSTEGL
jgi:hypothetical protein